MQGSFKDNPAGPGRDLSGGEGGGEDPVVV